MLKVRTGGRFAEGKLHTFGGRKLGALLLEIFGFLPIEEGLLSSGGNGLFLSDMAV